MFHEADGIELYFITFRWWYMASKSTSRISNYRENDKGKEDGQ
jgi:hypothetical protein